MPGPGSSLVRNSVSLSAGSRLAPHGLLIDADDVVFDGGGATLVGDNRNRVGIHVAGHRNVTIRNVQLRDFHHGILASRCTGLKVERTHITCTGEVAANTVFLDVWRPASQAYGGAILLDECEDSEIVDNEIQHQMCGLQTFGCRRVSVCRNVANYNSGFGFLLYETCDSSFEDNFADFCCRYEPRPGGGGHVGADAAGFLIVRGSCRNTFRRNFARLGGDGFFLAGLGPDGVFAPCDDNVFEENDASLSPNIAFEATFSRRNIFRNNLASRCNYGFWLGFSSENLLERNAIHLNRQGGVAVENGDRFILRGNDFQRNGCGVLMWSKYVPEWAAKFPQNLTCHDWLIEHNLFHRNDTAVFIGADRDHGVRPVPPELSGRPECRPFGTQILANDIQDNRIGIELLNADATTIRWNTLQRNVVCNTRRQDDRDTVFENNPGSAGPGF